MTLPSTLPAALATTLAGRPRRWLVTGAAGFIGSHLVEVLLHAGQHVVGLDNYSTGHRRNTDEVLAALPAQAHARLVFIEGDIRDPDTCARACEGVDAVLHQAALGSVPRSLADPVTTHDSNVNGFLNMLVAARDAKVGRFVYAASSSTYGDSPSLPKVEDVIGRPLSPYAVTKYVNELYADVFGRCYGLPCVGLRYFNVFGARQDPEGAYAAVIPRWARALLLGDVLQINGDGETSRDFCYVDNAVQANLLAALTTRADAVNTVYNVAAHRQTTLNQLFGAMRDELARRFPGIAGAQAQYQDFRAGDVRHSLADITRAQTLLDYAPSHDVTRGLAEAMDWYVARFAPEKVA
ncbi:MAG: SDR family oxidoreductase [Gammaproteobacteria bacterium]|nr:SDR family oxidoreductase [Gammaproteobacteria bacterium]MBU0770772.1 SDR family oxidoreductase [Gammaproteobacteria bacterium]MBU0856750.1 SDR family oxidoreductase [Gammaproteobacteria bacterium]MBU1845569.1 SDR family oxidoreductase [Gammaproteobacteria bacterium]